MLLSTRDKNSTNCDKNLCYSCHKRVTMQNMVNTQETTPWDDDRLFGKGLLGQQGVRDGGAHRFACQAAHGLARLVQSRQRHARVCRRT